jgi:carbon-monoxide dehydrogenase large subunit
VLAQVVAGVLGVPFEDVSVRQGDTAEVPVGVGTFGSRTAQAAGSAAYRAASELLARAREVAARMLGMDEGEVLVEAGRGLRTTDGRSVSWRELAQSCTEGGVTLEVEHWPDGQYGSAWPSGAVLAAVDIDSETGMVSVRSLVACDDVGVVLNPLIVDGQVQGGLALGVAHALVEEFRYDDDGSPATTNFGDYPVITVDLVPRAQLGHIVSPAPDNDLGAKGVGEAGTVGCPAAILNAVADALGPFGVRHVSPPATPERLLTAIEEARRNGG